MQAEAVLPVTSPGLKVAQAVVVQVALGLAVMLQALRLVPVLLSVEVTVLLGVQRAALAAQDQISVVAVVVQGITVPQQDSVVLALLGKSF
jgi:hypothetical protein